MSYAKRQLDNTLADELGEHFTTEAKAKARAEELNRADVSASLNLDPAFAQRRERLQALGETFWVRYGDGPCAARWPRTPGRYALDVYSERDSDSFWETYETLDEVRQEIEGGNVYRVVDLDTGKDVPFAVSVTLGDEVQRHLIQQLVDALYLRGGDPPPGQPDIVDEALAAAKAAGFEPSV